MRTAILLLLAALTPFCATMTAPTRAGEDPLARGTAIAEEWQRRDAGFGDVEATLTMRLTDRHGDSTIRKMRQRVLEVPAPDVGDKSLIVFDHPRDVKGTALLTHARILDPDDQWLYLPALKRTKRISSNNKSGPFVGSEFAYEDIGANEPGKYVHRYLREDACGDGWRCFVLELTPLYERSGYTRLLAWYDQAEYRLVKMAYYDRKSELLKTLEYSKFQRYLDRYWRAHDMYMVNHQTGKSTRLTFENFRFRGGLSDRDFRKNVLERVR